MPLPGSSVIHPDFQDHHKRTVIATMRCEITIERPSTAEPTWNPETGVTEVPASRIWPPTGSGSARVIQRTRTVTDRATQAAVESEIDYQISIPADTPKLKTGHDGDLITVVSCPDDPNLVGRVLRVEGDKHASTKITRTLLCVDHQNRNNPS